MASEGTFCVSKSLMMRGCANICKCRGDVDVSPPAHAMEDSVLLGELRENSQVKVEGQLLMVNLKTKTLSQPQTMGGLWNRTDAGSAMIQVLARNFFTFLCCDFQLERMFATFFRPIGSTKSTKKVKISSAETHKFGLPWCSRLRGPPMFPDLTPILICCDVTKFWVCLSHFVFLHVVLCIVMSHIIW